MRIRGEANPLEAGVPRRSLTTESRGRRRGVPPSFPPFQEDGRPLVYRAKGRRVPGSRRGGCPPPAPGRTLALLEARAITDREAFALGRDGQPFVEADELERRGPPLRGEKGGSELERVG